jgi:AsmA protein
MRVLFYALLTLFCLLLAGMTFVFVVGPSDILREQLADAVKAHTGRDLTIGGTTSFTIYPRPGIAIDGVTLSEPPAMGSAPFVRIARLELAVPFQTLLRQRLTFERIVLKGAIFDLRIDAAGRRNWDFEALPPGPAAGHKRAAPTGPVRVASADGGVGLLHLANTHVDALQAPAVMVGDISLADATVRYLDEAIGRREEITHVQAHAVIAPNDGKLTVDGKGTWRAEEVQAQASIASVSGMLQGSSPVAVKFTARPGGVRFEGTVVTAPQVQLDGKIQASAPSVRAAAAWLGASLPAASGAEALAVSGVITTRAGQIGLKNLDATVGETTMRGALTLTMSGTRPHLGGALNFAKLDLNSILGQGSSGASATSARPASPAPSKATSNGPDAGSIGGLIESIDKQASPPAKPQVRGWSNLPLDLAAFRLADADLTLETGPLLYRDFVLDRSKIATTLRDGVLRGVVQEARLYKGRATGTLDLDSAGPLPKLSVQAAIEGADTLALLKGAAGFDRLSGRGALNLKVAASGQTQQQMTESLAGTAAVSVADGAIAGFDIAAMIKQAQRGQMPRLAVNPAEKTDFSEMSGTFAIAGGVAQSQDVKLVSPAMRAAGAGQFDLGKQLMDWRLKPKLTAGPSPPAGGLDLSSLDIPILIRGPWDAPRVTVDLDGVVRDNSQIKKGVEQLGEVLKSKEGKEAAKEIGKTLRNLLGR